MTLPPMTREDVPPLLTLSGAVLATQRVRVGHITLSDRCRRPMGREKKKKPRCLIFGTRAVEADLELFCNFWSAGGLGERLYVVHVVVISRLAIGKKAMLAQSDAFLLRSLSGEQEQERFCASTQLRGSASGQAQHPSTEDLDGKSKSARSTQERRPRTHLDGMDGLRREPS